MATHIQLWQVDNDNLKEVTPTQLASEAKLETWIEKDPSILGTPLLIIGRQVQTDFGGRIDLLALDAEANTIVIELKRDRTPRDVVAQAIDYASWIQDLEYQSLDAYCQKHCSKSLSDAFESYFESPLPEQVNVTHGIIIVAADLDDSSERIVTYLAEQCELNINAVLFRAFEVDGTLTLARAALFNPEEVEPPTKKKAPWKGYYFVNCGEGEGVHRVWEDCKELGYLAAGQGPKWSRQIKKLNVGDPVFAFLKGHGYVGYGTVTQNAVMVKNLRVGPDDKPLLEHDLRATNPGQNSDDPELSDWAVKVKWESSPLDREKAKWFTGAFAIPTVVCKLRQPATVSFLEKEFGISKQNT